MYDLLEEKAPLAAPGGLGSSAPGPQGATTQQSMQPPGMGLLGQGHQLGQQTQTSHMNQQQPPHPSTQQLHQQQQQLVDQIRMQNVNARYQGTRTPGMGGI